jgi:Zn2+/Cd2+-exporting ATPase
MTATERALRYRVEGMDCPNCAGKVEAAVRRLPGVSDVAVSTLTQILTLKAGRELAPESIERALASIGHPPRLLPPSAPEPAGQRDADADGEAWWRSAKGRLTIASGAAVAAAWLTAQLVPASERWLFTAAVAVGLVPIARRAYAAARLGTPFSIEMLMTIAAVGAVLIGAAEEAAVVVVLFLIGELLEGVAARRARASISGLAALVPKTALVERGGDVVEIPGAQLAVGDVIRVRPGDRIAADGDVVAGEGGVDEAPVTGESVPVRKGPGAAVFAGTVNCDAVLRVRVTAAAADNTIARVVRLVEEAQERKAPTARFIDRFARRYTPAVMAVAVLVATVAPLGFGQDWSEWIYKGLAILLIGCPCALVISTPAAIAAALAAGARRGLLIKGGAVLETVGGITMALFDKTGTLTEGAPRVTDVVAFAGTEGRLLSLAAALESGSNHPLARAIVDHAKVMRAPMPPASDVKVLPGRGVAGRVGIDSVALVSPHAAGENATLTAEQKARIAALNGDGKTVSLLVAGDAAIGLIAMRDEPRPDSRAGLDALRALGVSTLMLTGDNAHTATAIAEKLGIEARAQLLPQDKQRIVRDLQAGGQAVAKIGDGINDAPALAAADVGIAMGGGTDVALETADAAVLHGRVMDVARMVKLSRAAMANIRQNISIALGLKAAFLVTTIAGVTGLWPAILADTGATVLVTANAMRLLAWK